MSKAKDLNDLAREGKLPADPSEGSSLISTPDECDLHKAGKLPLDPKVGTKLVSLPGSFALTDLGNAERLVARNRFKVRYSHQRRKWVFWTGQRWQWDERGQLEHLAKETVRSIYQEAADCPDEKARAAISQHARSSESARRLRSMTELAQSEPGVPIMVSELDADPWLLNCSNGTIDLRTGKLRPHSPTHLITKSTGVEFDPNARSELWERVLDQATGGKPEVAEYLQTVAGYSLIGLPLERACFFFYGEPGTAKSTFVRALLGALGDYGVSSSFETFCQRTVVGGNRGDLVRLRFVASSARAAAAGSSALGVALARA